MKRLVLLGLVVLVALAIVGVLDWIVVGAVLLGLAIWSIGVASFGSLRRGASYLPEGDPTPIDPGEERVTYSCSGCGAELLLLVRGGAATPPRHCGERMHEHREVPHLN